MAELAAKQLSFWSMFAASAATDGLTSPSPQPKNYLYLPCGAPSARLVVTVSFRDNEVGCKLALNPVGPRPGIPSEPSSFSALLADRASITGELGYEDLIWGTPTPTRVYRRLAIDLTDQARWQPAVDWLIDTSTQFTKVFGRYLSHTAAPVSTITELFTSLARQFGLRLNQGTFQPTGANPPMTHLGLYSTERKPQHRYAFGMWWGEDQLDSTVAWVLLNPATGDTDGRPRPILTGCRHLAEDWGYSALIIINLFAYRARDPRMLKTVSPQTAIGPYNDAILTTVSDLSAETIAAWGDNGTHDGRAERVKPLLRRPKCLPKPHATVSAKGQPFYPKGIRHDAERLPLP
jgi:hypothetical protein